MSLAGVLIGGIWHNSGRGRAVKVTVAPETTRIVAPLDEEGYPDYAAALEAWMSEGVTPETNAEIGFRRALGFATDNRAECEPYLNKLGRPDLWGNPPLFDRFAFNDPDPVLSDRETIDEMFIRSASTRWTRREFPLLAQWFDENKLAIDTLVEASRLPYRYRPLDDSTRHDPWNWDVAAPSSSYVFSYDLNREVSHLGFYVLRSRAMFRIGAGETQGAFEDAATAVRLACLSSVRVSEWERFNSQLAAMMAYQGFRQLLSYPEPNPTDLDRLAEILDVLPDPGSLAEMYDHWARYTTLARLIDLARMGPGRLEREEISLQDDATRGEVSRIVRSGDVDWDEVLRDANASFDELCRILRIPEYTRRRAELEALSTRYESRGASCPSDWLALSRWKLLPRIERSQRLSTLLVREFLNRDQDVVTYDWATQNLIARKTAIRVAVDVLRYRNRHGRFPMDLTELQQEFPERDIRDPFLLNTDLTYKTDQREFVVYSFGQNGIDDEGVSGWPTGGDDQAFVYRPQ